MTGWITRSFIGSFRLAIVAKFANTIALTAS